MRLPSVCAAAALAGVAALVAPVTATAAPHPHATHASSHTHAGKHAAKHDPLAGRRKGATAVITGQTRSVTRLLATENASKSFSDADKAALTSATANALSALAADKAAVASATTSRALQRLAQAAVGTAQVAREQYVVVLEADRQQSAAAELARTMADVQSKVAAAAAAGTDTTAAAAALTDLGTQLGALDANAANAAGAVTTILAVAPTASHHELVAALQSAHTALAPGETALKAARSDLAIIAKALAG